MPMTMEEMEKEINLLHDALTNRGVNSRRTADIFGREVRAQKRSTQILYPGARARESQGSGPRAAREVAATRNGPLIPSFDSLY